MNTVEIKGASAVLKWGYHQAAALESWSISGYVVTATVVERDAFRVTQAPLTFEVPRPNGNWTWSVQSLQITGDTLTARIDP